MKPFHAKSTVEQLAAYLREEILSGGLGGGMPGVGKLVRQLGVGTQTVVAALEILKQDVNRRCFSRRSSICSGEDSWCHAMFR
jgi:hypothetical protein